MRIRIHKTAGLFAALFLALQISGCSAIMFGVGSAVDHSQSREKSVFTHEWSKIDPGTDIIVLRTDSTKVAGKLVEFVGLSSDDYRARIGEAAMPVAESTSAVVVASDRSNVSIPMEQVEGIFVKRHTHYKWIFLGIGAVVDITAVLFLVALNNMELFGGGSWGYIAVR